MPSAGKKKNHKLLRVLGASSLALIMGASVLCGVLFAPMNSTQVNNAVENGVTANSQEQIEVYKQDIASGKIKYAPSPLGLDPENDPVVFVDTSGLEIKMHSALTNGNLSSMLYVTMGSYSGHAINWVIIQRNPNTSSLIFPNHTGDKTDISIPNFITTKESTANYYNSNIKDSATPAGTAINGQVSKQKVVFTGKKLSLSSIATDSALGTNQLRVVSEACIGSGYGTYASGDRSKYGGGDYAETTVYENKVVEYYNNNTLGTSTFKSNGILTTAFSICTRTYADLLKSRIAYNIGTTTAVKWWTDGTTIYNPQAGFNDSTRCTYRNIYNTAGTLTRSDNYYCEANNVNSALHSSDGGTAYYRVVAVINLTGL